MLVELKCEKFNDNIKNGINFNENINFISSYSDESNSIGKSTFLAIIDYIYGGKVLCEKSAITKLDTCEIYYCLKYDKLYYFKADCKNRNKIYECDKSYNVMKLLKYDDYSNFLKEHIGNKINFSFRGEFSEFFRFFNKKDINIIRPLSKNHDGSSPKEELNVLLDLFDKYDNYNNIEEDLKDKKNTQDAIKALEKSKSISSIIIDKKQYEDNKEQLSKISEKLDETYIDNADMIINITTENEDFFKLRSEYNAIVDRLMEIESLIESNNYTYNEDNAIIDLKRIKEFFDGIDIEKVKDLVKYHNDLKEVLKNDFSDTINDLKNEMRSLDKRKNEIEKDINSRGISKKTLQNITKNVVNKLMKKQVLEDQNKLFEKIEDLKASAKNMEKQLKQDKINDLKEIEKFINDNLVEICNKYFDNIVKPASFNIKTSSSYAMEYKDDDGSGCSHTNLILFDLIMLFNTKLPLLLHDSNLSSDIDLTKMKVLINLYLKSNKQIFVALSNCDRYDDETKNLIEKNQVIELGVKENRLFGNNVE